MAIHTLSIDVETFSDVDLKKCGVYKYAESPDFEILLFGVSVDGSEVTVYDLASGDTVPEEIIRALSDDSVIKWAYNASFERVCLSVWLRRNYPPGGGGARSSHSSYTSFSVSQTLCAFKHLKELQ